MFDGFTDRTFEFYMAIRFNNNRDFFQENHDWYKESVRDRMVALCEALAPTIEGIDRALDVNPSHCVARVNRDVRFSRDKSPYRDYSFMKYRILGSDRYSSPGFYFDLSDSGASFGMGIYDKNLPLMRAFGRWMQRSPDEALSLLDPIDRYYTLCPNRIKRLAPPPDLPEPLKKWYPLRGFYIEKELTDFSLIKSSRLVETLEKGYRLAAPLYTVLNQLEPIE